MDSKGGHRTGTWLLSNSETPPGGLSPSLLSDARPSVIYGPSISSGGRGVERAKFSRNTLHSAGADTNLPSTFQNALSGP